MTNTYYNISANYIKVKIVRITEQRNHTSDGQRLQNPLWHYLNMVALSQHNSE